MRLSVPAAIALLTAVSATEARTYGSILAPRRYQFSRPRDTFDLVSDIFSMPMYFNDFSSYANSLLRQHNTEMARLTRTSTPRYDVTEDPETGVVELTMEVPGVTPKDLTIELENNSLLRIKGSRKFKHNGSVVESEFDQTFKMDEGADIEQLEVTLSAGILRIKAPKKEKIVRRLEVSTDDEEMLLEAKAAPEEDPKQNVEEVDGITITDEGEDA